MLTCLFICTDVHKQSFTLPWKQCTAMGITDTNVLPPPISKHLEMQTFPFLSFGKKKRSHQKNVTFFPSQVNIQRYFYEVKISAYFKGLNGILPSQALGEGCWTVCSQPVMKCFRPRELVCVCRLAVLLKLNIFQPSFFKTLLDTV